MPTPCAKPPGSCLMLPMRTSRQRWPMSWPEATGTPGPSKAGPCGTGRLPPPGEPRQRHWHLAYRRDASAMTPGPMPPSQTIRQACRVNPMRVRIIRACRAGTVTNSSGILASASCPATSPIERSVPRRRCYCSRSCCSPPQPGGEQPSGCQRPWLVERLRRDRTAAEAEGEPGEVLDPARRRGDAAGVRVPSHRPAGHDPGRPEGDQAAEGPSADPDPAQLGRVDGLPHRPDQRFTTGAGRPTSG